MNGRDLQRRLRPVLIAIAAAGLAGGLALHWGGNPGAAPLVWTAATLPVLAALLVEIVTSLRRGEFGLDVLAALSMTAALSFSETLAAAVVALMYAGGQALEAFAEGRAKSEMTALLARVPRSVLRHRDGGLEDVALEAVVPGDRLLIRHGDTVPVDGTLAATAVLDLSALTGEAMPMRFGAGDEVSSGVTNAGDPFDLLASRPAAESTFAGIVRLVRQAQTARAPMTRMADRYALGFLGLAVALAGGAWAVTGDPIRAVAVLVIATPCPLILAVPVALVAGLSQAAAQGILIKGGKALESLATVTGMVVDKTGTLTDGQPGLVETRVGDGISGRELLRLAASLDQASHHTIAMALVAEARRQGLSLARPEAVTETPGDGVEGLVEGRRISVGGRRYVAARCGLAEPPQGLGGPGQVTVAVGIDGIWAGELILADRLRDGTGDFVAGLRATGIRRIVLATGDRPDVADAVADGLALDAIHAGLSPERKIAIVVEERANGRVMMVGDGVNDAPALAAADLGVAMGARGAAASAEAADVVLLVDRLDRILPARRIAQRARRIALQSVVVGIGLSAAGMVAAALGFLTPVEGALLQEVIDVAAILNALRALRPAG
ncbi:MAG: heavy metal translocating P-type ATPase [Paracoccaceae bacterium]|nr:heavy metal translocating P-type ATPase [Paracoccaceae bacterium]